MKKKRIIALAAGAALALTIGIAPPAQASPNGLCIAGQCGQVTNWGPKWLTVKNAQFQSSISPNTRTNGYYDWDYVWVPSGGCVYRHSTSTAARICSAYKTPGFWTPVANSGMTIFSTGY